MYVTVFHAVCGAVKVLFGDYNYNKQVEEYSKVKLVPDKVTESVRESFAPHDKECFNPPYTKQLYETVKQILLAEKWKRRIKKAVVYVDDDHNFLKVYLRKLFHISELVSVTEEVLINSNYWQPYPKTIDFNWVENRPRRTHFYIGTISQPDKNLLLSDAVVAIDV